MNGKKKKSGQVSPDKRSPDKRELSKISVMTAEIAAVNDRRNFQYTNALRMIKFNLKLEGLPVPWTRVSTISTNTKPS
jgi:hypothetical protein